MDYLTITDPLNQETLERGDPPVNEQISALAFDAQVEGVMPGSISGGEFISNLTINDGYLQSNNFVTGTTGWQFTPTSCEINVSTAILSLDIPDATTDNSFHTNSTGNSWWGCNVADFATDPTNADAYILNTGALYCASATIAGATITTPTITSIQTGSEIAIQGWTHDLVFSITDLNTVAWASGTITLMNGDTYSIDAGNTGNMAAETFVYLDIATSITVLQITTTKATAVGSGKIMVAVAQNGTVEPTFVVFGSDNQNLSGTDIVAQSILAANIAANTITANEIAGNTITASEIFAGTITATEITGTTLSAIYADLGTITAGSISVVNGAYTIGLTPAGANAIFSGTTGAPEFAVTPAGALTATSATITGAITISSGSGIANLTDAGAIATEDTIGNSYIDDLAVDKLTAGTITSKAILLAVSAGVGDVEIRAGIATGDFANAGNASGFIIGIDDSDDDTAKSYIGDANHYTKFDGTDLISTGMKIVEKFTCGEEMTAGDTFTIGRQTDYDYTSSIVTVNDTYVDENDAAQDYSADTVLGIKDVTNFRQAAYIKFDVTDMSDRFTQVLLRFYVDAVANTNPITVYRITANWTDSTTNWNAKPAVDANQTWGSVDPAGTGWKEIDITELFLLWKAGVYTNYGIRLSLGNLSQGGNTTIGIRSEDYGGSEEMFRSTSLQNTTTIWKCESAYELSINNYMGVVLVGASASASALCQLGGIVTGAESLVAGSPVYANPAGAISTTPLTGHPLKLGTAISTTTFRMEDIKRYARGVGSIVIANLSEKLAIITPFRPMLFKIKATWIDNANVKTASSEGSCRGNVAGQQGCVYYAIDNDAAARGGTSTTHIIYLDIGGVDITAQVSFVENSGVTMSLAGSGTFYYEWEAFS